MVTGLRNMCDLIVTVDASDLAVADQFSVVQSADQRWHDADQQRASRLDETEMIIPSLIQKRLRPD